MRITECVQVHECRDLAQAGSTPAIFVLDQADLNCCEPSTLPGATLRGCWALGPNRNHELRHNHATSAVHLQPVPGTQEFLVNEWADHTRQPHSAPDHVRVASVGECADFLVRGLRTRLQPIAMVALATVDGDDGGSHDDSNNNSGKVSMKEDEVTWFTLMLTLLFFAILLYSAVVCVRAARNLQRMGAIPPAPRFVPNGTAALVMIAEPCCHEALADCANCCCAVPNFTHGLHGYYEGYPRPNNLPLYTESDVYARGECLVDGPPAYDEDKCTTEAEKASPE